MAKRTGTHQVAPWTGGLVTSTDAGFLQPGQLTSADNIIFDFDSSKRRRDGINYDWDNANVNIFKNGVDNVNLLGNFNPGLNSYIGGSIDLLAGEYIDLRPSASNTPGATTASMITIYRIGN